MKEIEVHFSNVQPGDISYVAIGARHKGKWLFIKHRERGGYEIPAGHPEEGETTEAAAGRELTEETGAQEFTLKPVTYYSVTGKDGTQHGRLFYADVASFGEIKDKKEVEDIFFFDKMPENLSLPEVMRALFCRLTTYL